MRGTTRASRLGAAGLGLAIWLATTSLGSPVLAQDDIHGHISAGLLGGFPQGEFKRSLNDVGYGVGGSAGAFFSETVPLALTLSMGYMVYGSESREEPFSSTIPDVTVRVTTTNSILLGHFSLRLQPRSGPLRPYLEGMAGFNYLYTDTKIEDIDESEEVATSTNFDDAVFSYGLGGGVMIPVYEGAEHVDPDNRAFTMPFTVSLNLGVSYLLGGEAGYLKKGSIRRSGQGVAYDVTRSKTDLLAAHIEVALSR